ncbi:MAG: phage tail tape measure protein, partial [Gammaproteobacteria bacterium HGW-Gammaproteobacteria-8]
MSGAAIAALGSTITGVGISEQVAATGIKNLMLTMTMGTAATDKQKTAFRALGMDAEEVAERMQEDATGAIRDLLAAVRDLNDEDQPAILTQLFGRSTVTAVAPLLKNLDTLEENFRKVGDTTQYTGSMEHEFRSIMDITAASVASLGRVLNRTATIIGNVFLPPIKLGATILATVFHGINEVATAMPWLTTVVVAAATTWLVWGAAVNAVKFGLTFMPGTVTKLTRLIPTFTAVTALASGALSTFTGIAAFASVALAPIIGGVMAVAVAGFLLYKYWQPVKAFFGGLFSGLWNGIQPLRDGFTDAFAPVAPIFNAIGSAIRPVIGWFKALLSPVNATSDELAQVASMGQRVGEVIGKAFTVVTTPLQAALKLVGAILAGFRKAVDMGKEVARFFGFGETDSAVVEEAEKTIQKAVEKSPASSAGRTTVQQTNHTEAPIHIHPAPGQSAEEIGEVVARKLAELQQRNDARRRSALYDV